MVSFQVALNAETDVYHGYLPNLLRSTALITGKSCAVPGNNYCQPTHQKKNNHILYMFLHTDVSVETSIQKGVWGQEGGMRAYSCGKEVLLSARNLLHCIPRDS